MDRPIKQKNIFEPTWPSEYHDLIRDEIFASVHDEKFNSVIYNGKELSKETIFEKLRFASDAFAQLSNRESKSGDHHLIADFYKNMSDAFKKLSNDSIFKLNRDSVLTINSLIETLTEKLQTNQQPTTQ